MAVFSLGNLGSVLTSYITDNPIYKNQDARVILFALGAGLVFFKILSLFKTLLSLLQMPKDLSARYGKGTWVVISGGSEGIGKAFGFELASKGFNLVLISRRKDKLEEAAKEIKEKYPSTQTRVVVADFAKAHEDGFAEKILEQVKDLDVSILVNNAGITTEAFYTDIPVKKIRDLVTVNCLSHALLTRVFLPKLSARKQKSAIINVASLGAVAAVPVYQLYTASKAFLDYLSRGLSYEHNNIDILSFKPGMVSTAMSKYKKVDHETITVEECVKSALKELGHSNETIGHFKHKRQLAILMSLPNFMLEGYIKNVILPNGRKAANEAKGFIKED